MSDFTEFEKAIMRNRVAEVKQFLQEGEAPDSTALTLAIQSKANDVLRILIAAGADVNRREWYWAYTPLIRALHERNLEAFRILLKAGASVDKKGLSQAALHEAAEEGFVEFGKLSIAAGAKLELRDHSGNTPLMWAASMGKLGMVKLLIKSGANPLALNLADKTSHQLADENGHRKIARFLAPISKRRPPVKRGPAALVQAVQKQDMPALERCLKRGVDVNGRDRFGTSPMDRAISQGAIPFVKRLIEAEIDLNRVSSDGISFLEASLRAEKLDIARLLLESGALPNPPGNLCSDPLNHACIMRDIELARLLINKGSNPRTPGLLDTAANTKAVEVMKLLLDLGASVGDIGFNGGTPLFWAVFTPPPLCKSYRVKELKKSVGKGVTITPPPKRSAVETSVKLLIEHGADVNHLNNEGRTALTYTRWPSVARLLIDAGARLDICDKNGRTVRSWLKGNGVKIGKL